MDGQKRQEMVNAYVTSKPYEHFRSFGFGHDLNEELRQASLAGTPTSKETAAVADLFDGAFTDTSETKLVLYRAAPRSTIDPFLGNGHFAYPAYMSTSRDLGAAALFLLGLPQDSAFCLLKIFYPTGSPYIDCANFNGENEVLLPRNLRFAASNWELDEEENMRLMAITTPIEKFLLLRAGAA